MLVERLVSLLRALIDSLVESLCRLLLERSKNILLSPKNSCLFSCLLSCLSLQCKQLLFTQFTNVYPVVSIKTMVASLLIMLVLLNTKRHWWPLQGSLLVSYQKRVRGEGAVAASTSNSRSKSIHESRIRSPAPPALFAVRITIYSCFFLLFSQLPPTHSCRAISWDETLWSC